MFNEPPSSSRQGNGLALLSPNIGSQLGGSKASRLAWLDLSNNSLQSLPPSLGLCSKLQTLRISFNQLKVCHRVQAKNNLNFMRTISEQSSHSATSQWEP